MTRQQLEHLIRAAANIADEDELVIVDSQSILGQFPDAPASLLTSMEADLYPKNAPEKADLIEGSIGELSPFHDTYGYYAEGVGEETARLPRGWQERLVPVCNANTRGATGLCLEVHDLLVSKCVAGRDKDIRFAKDAVKHGLVQEWTLRERLAETDLAGNERRRVEALVSRLFSAGG